MSMSANGQLACFFMLTHPHMTAVGGLRATAAGLSSEHPKLSEKAFREPFEKGIVKVDSKAPLIWFPNFLKYNPPENPNVVKAWAKSLNSLPECDTKMQIIQNVKDFLEDFSEAFQEAWPQASLKQEQEQEQEQEHISNNPPPKNNFSYTQSFLEFWEVYPKKKAKGDAFRAWNKIKPPQPPTEEIIEAVQKYKKTEQWQTEKYIPYPATFINRRQWEDEISGEQSRSKKFYTGKDLDDLVN